MINQNALHVDKILSKGDFLPSPEGASVPFLLNIMKLMRLFFLKIEKMIIKSLNVRINPYGNKSVDSPGVVTCFCESGFGGRG